MSLLRQANRLYREKKFKEAELLYEKILTDETHDLIRKTSVDAIIKINSIISKHNKNSNCIATASNDKFFNSLAKLIKDALISDKSKCLSKIYVFDLGMEAWQVKFLRNIRAVEVLNMSLSPDIDYGDYSELDLPDVSTYFFKVAAFNEIVKKSSQDFEAVNLLWLDAGNTITNDLSNIFDIINHDEYFFVDHSDVSFIYKNPENSLANCLSPKMFDNDELELRKPTSEESKKPYIKANCFGLKLSSSRMRNLIDQHRSICTKTKCLKDPREIKGNIKFFWNKYHRSDETCFNYRLGRHEQSVWSYLVIVNKFRIRSSTPYSFTVAAGTGLMNKQTWSMKIKSLFSESKSRYTDKNLSFGPLLNSIDPQKINSLSSTNYLQIAQSLYFDNPSYQGVGFPCPDFASKSLIKLDRGAYTRTDEYKYLGELLNDADNIKEEVFILLGNGPSLADVDLKSLEPYDTWGLNAAYRAYKKINFWPKYFGCFDALVCDHHSDEFKRLIQESKIDKFFFINFDDSGKSIFTEPEILNSPKFQNINFQYRTTAEKYRTDIFSPSFQQFIDMRTSGANTIQSGLLMGYRKFIMLGVDQNYVEVVDGAKKDNNYHKLVMEKTPDSNPNYWFSDYQQAGDKFNRPNLQKSQIPAWNNLSCTLETLGIKCEIYNGSPITQLNAFKKLSLDDALRYLNNVSSTNLSPFKSPLTPGERVFIVK